MQNASLQRLIGFFPEQKIDSFIVSALPNVRYLSGFTGSNALLLVTLEEATLFTDPRYTLQAAGECVCRVRIVTRGKLYKAVVAYITRKQLKKIGFERNRVSWGLWSEIKENLPMRAELAGVENVIEQLRMIKSADEIAAIRASVSLNSEAFDEATKAFREGMRECDLAAEIDYRMRRLGAAGAAFETIVASGERSALPHARPSEAMIEPNQLLLIDMGASAAGYMSDMTRTLAVGRVSAAMKSMYRAVLESQLAAIDAVRPGVAAAAVDRTARDVLKAHGMDREFVHSTGHGLGIEIHEAPRLGRGERTKLAAGMTITIEPGVYRAGLGGVRIEDTVLVTPSGCEVLTPTPKELLSI